MVFNKIGLILFCVVLFVSNIEGTFPFASIKQGNVSGAVMKSSKGREFYAFLGIPYAQPPVGDKRFEPPEPPFAWNDLRDCTQEGPLCIQRNFPDIMLGSEDCLYLNVYSPKLPHELRWSPLPVMVFLHGGAFTFGVSTPTYRGPQRLLDRDIVLVIINYRLGPLGFLSTEDENAPGNYGMLDQVAALHWVQENIAAFGGNRNSVTLFGDSAGGASTLYHMLSPLSKGLFHRVIAMSGSPLCPWAFQESPLQWTKQIASDVGCQSRDSDHLVKCLKKIPASQLAFIAGDYFKYSFLPIAFAPTLDLVRGSGAFLPKHPREIFLKGEINRAGVMIGITKDEGAFVYAEIMHQKRTNLSSEEEVMDVVLEAMDEEMIANIDVSYIMEQYFQGIVYKNVKEVRKRMIELLSDCLFRSCHFLTINYLLIRGFHPFVFSHDYKPDQFTVTKYFGIKEFIGVGHVDYLPFLFDGNVFGEHHLSGRDLAMSQLITRLWTSFATHGNPTYEKIPFEWLPSTHHRRRILRIDHPSELIEFNDYNDSRLQIWMPVDNILKRDEL